MNRANDYFDAQIHAACPFCGGSQRLKGPAPNLQCPCCRGAGKVKITAPTVRCPACRGTGRMKIVVGPSWAQYTKDVGRCTVCRGSGHLGGTVSLGTCKCCSGSGRWRGPAPNVACPFCKGGAWYPFVHDTHPIVLGLEPVGLGVLMGPKIGLHGGVVHFEGIHTVIDMHNARITIEPQTNLVSAYVYHMNLVCMSFDSRVNDALMETAALQANHPWGYLLHAAVNRRSVPTPIASSALAIHSRCPPNGPNSRAPSIDWARDNRWVRCTDQARHGNLNYNGLDFLSLEVLLRLCGMGNQIRVDR